MMIKSIRPLSVNVMNRLPSSAASKSCSLWRLQKSFLSSSTFQLTSNTTTSNQHSAAEEEPRRLLLTKSTASNVLYEKTTENLLQHAKYIQSCLPSLIQQISLYKDELTLYIPPSAVPKVFQFLRDNTATQYKQLMDVAGVDYPDKINRFEVVYHLMSIRYNSRIRVKTYCAELGSVPSISDLYPAANWFEREAWDMYGIFFTGHPDLRRILTDYGFNGHPLRKDFPLTGYTQVRYDEEKKRVVSEPLDMAQQFRFFDYQSPWEQIGPGESVPIPTKAAPAAEKKPESK